MLACLQARWAREKEEAKIAEMNSKIVNVYTIQTTNDDPPNLFKDDEIDFDNCNLTEVIKFLQKQCLVTAMFNLLASGALESFFRNFMTSVRFQLSKSISSSLKGLGGSSLVVWIV